VDHISFPYRSFSHLTLLHVIAESGSLEKHGLEVDYDRYISSTEAHRAIPNGEVEFVGGNHVSTYGHRARGDDWVYLGQTVNYVDHQLVVRSDSDIRAVSDLKGRKVGTRGSHPELNTWLYLKQHGLDCDRDEVELVNQLKYKTKRSIDSTNANDPEGLSMPMVWELVKDGTFDAALLPPPNGQIAQGAGLKVIDIDPLPMIWHTTISSSPKFVEKHPDIVERLLKGIIEGIHFFKTKPAETMEILQRRYTQEGTMTREQAAATYAMIAPPLEPNLFPTTTAIANVYEEAKRQDDDANRVNPLELWDLHHIRKLADSGFVAKLYGGAPKRHA
jgi:NitT/TauT family transport system substrate-binding protein